MLGVIIRVFIFPILFSYTWRYIMTKQLSIILALVTVLVGIEGAVRVRTALAAHQHNPPEVVAVQVDGVLYSRAEYVENFGHLDLHWVADNEARAQGILIAYTTEENRDAALRSQQEEEFRSQQEEELQPAQVEEQQDVTYLVCRNSDGGGGCLRSDKTIENLAEHNFNNVISYVNTRERAIILYDGFNRGGCSLFVQRQKTIDLDEHDFCGVLTGDWNDKTSSISIES
jgi:hypothetical protein